VEQQAGGQASVARGTLESRAERLVAEEGKDGHGRNMGRRGGIAGEAAGRRGRPTGHDS